MLAAKGAKRLYVCDECGKSFNLSDHLTRHKRTHSGQRLLKCTYCDKAFADNYNLKRHVMIHTGPFKCEVCELTFTEKNSLGKHMREHAGIRYDCQLCDKTFSKFSSLRDHMLSHTGQKPFKCEWCGVSYSKKDYLNRHTGGRTYECPLCGRFVCKGNMNIHLKQHYDDGHHNCYKCDLSFSDMNQLAMHFKHYPSCNLGQVDVKEEGECIQDSPIVICVGTVLEEFPQKIEEVDALENTSDFRSIIKEEFKDEKDECVDADDPGSGLVEQDSEDMPCEKTAGDTLSTSSSKEIGQVSQTEVPLPFKCGRCDKRYVSMSQLNKCLKSHKPGEVLQVQKDAPEFHAGQFYECDVCGSYFTKAQNLKMHKMRKHQSIEGERVKYAEGLKEDFQCDKCGISFSQEAYLTNHRKSCKGLQATNPTKKKCDKCHKELSKSNFSKHYKKCNWNGQQSTRVYASEVGKCDMCGLLMSKPNIARHMRTVCPGKAAVYSDDFKANQTRPDI